MIWLALGSVVSGGPGNLSFGLLTDIGELLTEVAAAMDERDCDHGGGGVSGGAEGIAGEHAQATGVSRQGWGRGRSPWRSRRWCVREIECTRGDGKRREESCGG